MKLTRIFTGEDKQSHFEDLDIPLAAAQYGRMSELLPAIGVIFRETPAGGALDFHPAPRRQLVVTLSGLGEIECGDGSRKRFGPGDVMLAEDTIGQGHITREIQPRQGLFIPIPPDFNIGEWCHRTTEGR